MQLEIASSLPPTAQTMYGRMLRRATDVAATILREQQPTIGDQAAHEWLQCLAETIAIGRNGWREGDLRRVVPEITGIPWSELLFSSVRRAYRGHLIQRGPSGQWDFYHRELRKAVADYFASRPDYLRRLHAVLAAYLETLADDNPLRRAELMHHLIGADDKQGAARFYASSEHGSDELQAGTESLADVFRARHDAVEWVGSLVTEPGLSVLEQVLLGERMMYPLHDALANEGRVQERRALVSSVRDHTVRLADQAEPGPERDLALRQHSVSLLRLADLTVDVGDVPEARHLYEEHLRYTEERLRVMEQPGTLAESRFAQQDLSVALERLGDIAEREGDVESARKCFRRQLTIGRRLVDGASDDRQSLGYLASALTRLGYLALAEGDHTEADDHLREAAETYDRIALLSNEETSIDALNIRARLAEATDRMKEARELLLQYEELLHRHAETAPEDVEAQIAWATSLERLGDVALFERDNDEAARSYTQMLQITERLATLLPDDVAVQRQWSLSLEKVADAALKDGEPGKARPYYEQSLVIRERLHAMLPDDIRTHRDLGLAHERLGMLEDEPPEKQLPDLEQAVAIYAELYERLPDNEEAGRTLAIGHFNLAHALGAIPDRELDALEHSNRSHELLSDLRARGRQLDPTAKRLLAFLDTQFGGAGRWTHPLATADETAYAELNMLGMIGAQALAAGDYETAEENFRGSLEAATQINHPPSIVRAYGSLGEVNAKAGKIDAALELFDEAISVARENELPVEEGQTLDRLADLYAEFGERDRALALYSERVEVARRSDDQRGVALGSANVGVMHFERGEFSEALEYLQAAAELFDSYGMLPHLAHAYSYLGYLYQSIGDVDGSIAAYSRHIALSRQIGDLASAAGSMANLSQVLYAVGEREEAIALGEQASDYLERTGSPQAQSLRARIEAWKQG